MRDDTKHRMLRDGQIVAALAYREKQGAPPHMAILQAWLYTVVSCHQSDVPRRCSDVLEVIRGICLLGSWWRCCLQLKVLGFTALKMCA